MAQINPSQDDDYMKLVRQPEGSSLCGQACVATIAGVSLEESIRAFDGTRGGTRTKQVINALRKFGIACGDKLLRITKKRIEVKHRKSVPVSCYKWLGIKNNCGVRTLAYDVDNPPNYLIMRKDNMPWLVVMPLDEFLLLIPKEDAE